MTNIVKERPIIRKYKKAICESGSGCLQQLLVLISSPPRNLTLTRELIIHMNIKLRTSFAVLRHFLQVLDIAAHRSHLGINYDHQLLVSV